MVRLKLNISGRRLVRKLIGLAMLAVAVTACSKTESGDLEVEKPVVGTVTDTLNVPSVEVGTDTTAVTVPNVDVRKDTVNIKTPTIDVKK
jgi:hypothetical protein